MKTVIGLFMCMLLASMAPSVSAATVDISSPQEGVTLAPGDTIELAVTVTNDSESADIAVLTLDMASDGNEPGNIPGINHKPIRMRLAPGESKTINLELVLPDYKKLPSGSYDITISASVKGLISGIQASDSVSLLMVKP